MEKPIIILQGITVDELLDRIEERFVARESKKVSPLTYTEVQNQLGITNKTLMKVRTEMNLTDIYQSDINRILLRYPKYLKKAKIE